MAAQKATPKKTDGDTGQADGSPEVVADEKSVSHVYLIIAGDGGISAYIDDFWTAVEHARRCGAVLAEVPIIDDFRPVDPAPPEQEKQEES